MSVRILWACILFASSTSVLGQSLETSFQVGVGHYKMTDLKLIMKHLKVPLDKQLVYDFPPYYYYQPELAFTNDKIHLGLCYTFQSTGSRMSVKDYSGEYRLDLLTRSHGPGIFFKGRVLSLGGFGLRLYGESGAIFSALSLDEFIEVNERNYADTSFDFSSRALYLEPGVSISYSYLRYSISVNLGYSWQFKATPLKEVTDGWQLNVPLSQLDGRTDWSGLRYGITMGIKWF